MRLRSIGALMAILLSIAVPAFADQVVEGRLGPGALYRLSVPTAWNGSLVLYAHGFVASSNPVTLPPDGTLIENLVVPQGFAVAYSSFSENGWAVKDGAQRTEQLLGIFRSKFGNPSHVYIGGASMGSLIAIKLVEQHPGWFDGMLAACPVTGAQQQADYQANVRALFDVFYPGVLPGNAGGVSAGINVTAQIVLPATAVMEANPAGAFAIASMTQTPVPFSNSVQLGTSIVTALRGHATATEDLLPQLHGKPYFDNSSVQYTSASINPAELAVINGSVGRFVAAPSALNYLDQYYQPTGGLQIPTLMLSNALDPVAPDFNRASYFNAVAATGQKELLVQRVVGQYGHCDELIPEIPKAFSDLVAWVEFGIKPAP
jgi:pimeloyl-ACP methyl ester carboxylesterase